MYELEEGEVGESDEENVSGDEAASDQEMDEDGNVMECMATSLFDALAAAQESSEKYQYMVEEPREDHRLPENFLTKAFEFAIKQPWRTHIEAEQSSTSDLEERFRVGYVCEAIWPGDDLWYAARIIRVKTWKDRIVVRYSGFSCLEEEELTVHQIRGVACNRKRTKIKLGHLKRTRKHNKGKKMKFTESTEKDGECDQII